MSLRFTKMQGLGNDFVVIDGIRQTVDITPKLAKRISDRHFGIGCDQILLVESSTDGDADFVYRIWNQDGGEVEQCGNGARCFARFVRDKGLTDKDAITVETKGGIIILKLESDGSVTVDMGVPVFEPDRIPFSEGTLDVVQLLHLDAGDVMISVVSMGNPHAVQVVENIETAPVTTQGPLIEHHERFPKRVNVGYMQIVDGSTIQLRVWERGAGETLACGTGACAAVVSGIRRDLLKSPVRVQMKGGELKIAWAGDGKSVLMTGPAVTVFEGEINL